VTPRPAEVVGVWSMYFAFRKAFNLSKTDQGDIPIMNKSPIAAALLATLLLVGCSSTPDKDGAAIGIDSGMAVDGDSRTAGIDDASSLDEARLYAGKPSVQDSIIYFDFDSYAVRSEFRELLRAHARFLNENHQRRVTIEGHTDERGSREYNIALGERRANAVRDILLINGVSPNQITVVSYGKERPAVEGTGEAVWSKNRRAELIYGSR